MKKVRNAVNNQNNTIELTRKAENSETITIVTSGSTYLDIDAYACCVAMAELLCWQGKNAIAYSMASCNYSVCKSIVSEGQMVEYLPREYDKRHAEYVVVDVSDPDYIKDSVPLEQVIEVYDHHVGFDEYWMQRIGKGAHIEFIGAAATLVFRAWKNANFQKKMTFSTARLLVAAILDNTLNLTSENTTKEDKEAFNELCRIANIPQEWCTAYFMEVQKSVEADLHNALSGDIKTIKNHAVLPPKVAQLCVWDVKRVLERLPEIREWFAEYIDGWMINIIDIGQHYSCFICDNGVFQRRIENAFQVHFDGNVAIASRAYLRKELLKMTQKK